MREYGFELQLCAHLETRTDGIIARQLGGSVSESGRRILDIVEIEPGEEFERRQSVTPSSIPPRAIHCDVGVGRWRRWSAMHELSSEAADRLLERAVDTDFFEVERHRGTTRVRQTVRYPDWIGRLTAIENKPDLGSPGNLASQLRHDVSLGLVDRVVLATESHVTGAHLNRIPDAVGVWRVTPADGAIDVVREPTRLDVDGWGLEIGDGTVSKRNVRAISPAEKSRARVRLAEAAYGKGWRPSLPACQQARLSEAAGTRSLPYCDWKDRVVDPGGCGPACPGHEAGSAPSYDWPAEREDRTGWVADPAGFARKQAGIGEFCPAPDGP